MVLQRIDWLAIGAYVAVIAAASLLLSRKPGSSEDYFLAGRSLRWPFIGASLFAANISAEHFVGLAGSGYSGGMAVGGYEWSAVFCLVPLITLFLPFYVKNRVFTVPEFLEQRYGTGIRLFFSGFMVVLSVLSEDFHLALGLVARLLEPARLESVRRHLGRGPRHGALHDEGRPRGSSCTPTPCRRPCSWSPP